MRSKHYKAHENEVEQDLQHGGLNIFIIIIYYYFIIIFIINIFKKYKKVPGCSAVEFLMTVYGNTNSCDFLVFLCSGLILKRSEKYKNKVRSQAVIGVQ